MVRPPIDLELLLEAQDPTALQAALAEIARVVSEACRTNNLARCEHLVAWAACEQVVGRLHAEVLVSCLRQTYSVRSEVLSWPDLLEAAERTLSERGEDVGTLLHGLKEGT